MSIIYILGGSLFFLTDAILITDAMRAGQMDSTVAQVLRVTGLHDEGPEAARIQQAHDMVAASFHPGPSATGAEPSTATVAVLGELASRADLSDEQRGALLACRQAMTEPGPDPARVQTLQACLLALDGARAEARALLPSPDLLRAANELLKEVRGSQQEQRGFWLQLAQIVLLNLLLPLLTAVFGYVFGREQRERDERGG